MDRIILHVDLDSFYASVEARDNPEYKNKPLIVGPNPKEGKVRGVVLTCSYEARKFGIHSAMPISRHDENNLVSTSFKSEKFLTSSILLSTGSL